ncbi:PREDICTED: uncharacterized protein LOC101315321 isoform X2 [Fragaria vesca subsp. vesca]|uniref:uncharacterized protein LOC101315321 isoform X2 n=1 Tax=Fragaria vesca subsp. vesca TaxID=101020 RepID=UPI0002C30D9F|nr:PREDICTED: uncharacterized protein LOC101315321 isoform X2 [Fragaria vesca subsp. vesca]
MMMMKNHRFVTWEEHIVCHARGNRVVHYYLKKASGEYVLAVIGTEKSIRHMLYVVSDEFLETCGSNASINACTRWRARREVVHWLGSLLSKRGRSEVSNSPSNETTETLSLNGVSARQTDQMVPRKLKGQNSHIEWSGVAWICGKQLKHYPAFCRNGTTVSVHSFVYIMALEKYYYLGYVEDMYEDRKGKRKVKVRWFHHSKEVEDVIPDLNPHQREVFITPHVQVISAECIDGPATVLTPIHYEKCLAVAHSSLSGVHMCFRQFKNHEVRPFSLAKLRGYSTQAILSSLHFPQVSKKIVKCHMLYDRDAEEQTFGDPLRVYSKRTRSYEEHQGCAPGYSGIGNLHTQSQLKNCVPTYPKLKIKLSRKAIGVDVESVPQCPLSFKVDEKIELLCQDSGIRGCWFRCKVLKTSQKLLKVQYHDVQDVDGSGNLKEWVPAFRVASPDKLGMRCSGRLTIRPCHPNDSAIFSIEVGVPVDAWWSDGWWEGVVAGVDASGTAIQVYFPGEDKLLTFQRQNIRASRDWVDNKWVDIKARPDILLHISENVRCSIKIMTPYASATAEGCCSKVHTSPKFEVFEEKPELLNLVPMGDGLENEKMVNLRKQPCISKDKNNNSSNGCTCSKDDSIVEEEVDPACETCRTPQAMEVATQD